VISSKEKSKIGGNRIIIITTHTQKIVLLWLLQMAHTLFVGFVLFFFFFKKI
jgi:hypothetical protein